MNSLSRSDILASNLSLIKILQEDKLSLLSYLDQNKESLPACFSALIFLMIIDTYPKEEVLSFFQKTKLHHILKRKMGQCRQYKFIII